MATRATTESKCVSSPGAEQVSINIKVHNIFVAGGSLSDLFGQQISLRHQQLTPGRPVPALTPPAKQGMWGSTLDLTLASQQGSTGPPHFLSDNSNVAPGVAASGGATATTPIPNGGMHVSRSRKASRMGADTTTALANALSGIR